MKASVPGALLIAAMLGGALIFFTVGNDGGVRIETTDHSVIDAGRVLYAENCAECHGEKLEGQPDWRSPLPEGGLPAPPHDAGGHTWHHADQLLFDYTKKGGAALAPDGFKSNMPAFAETLSDAEIVSILAFIKSTWPEKQREYQTHIDTQQRQAKK